MVGSGSSDATRASPESLARREVRCYVTDHLYLVKLSPPETNFFGAFAEKIKATVTWHKSVNLTATKIYAPSNLNCELLICLILLLSAAIV